MLKLNSVSAAALLMFLLFACTVPAGADTLGPALSYDELRSLAASARDGDVLLISGDFSAEGGEPLSSPALLHITSDRGPRATVRHLGLRDAAVSFSDVNLFDTLTIEGTSDVELLDGVTVTGSAGQSALVFSGSGSLLVNPGCEIIGGSNGDGIQIAHRGGDFYASLEGVVRGGDGSTGGAGVTVSPLQSYGTMMISGDVRGGDGTSIGGNALNLYDMSSNAFITVAGNVRGGRGPIGGDGIQIVSIQDNVSIGVSGTVSGGRGVRYGGDALILMNASDGSTVNLTGSFSGGDATDQVGEPGQSLLIVGQTDLSHTRVVDCMLEDGKNTFAYNHKDDAVTPLPEITSSVDDVDPLATPSPTPIPAPTDSPVTEPTPSPTETPTPLPTEAPTAAPSDTPPPEATAGEADAQAMGEIALP